MPFFKAVQSRLLDTTLRLIKEAKVATFGLARFIVKTMQRLEHS